MARARKDDPSEWEQTLDLLRALRPTITLADDALDQPWRSQLSSRWVETAVRAGLLEAVRGGAVRSHSGGPLIWDGVDGEVPQYGALRLTGVGAARVLVDEPKRMIRDRYAWTDEALAAVVPMLDRASRIEYAGVGMASGEGVKLNVALQALEVVEAEVERRSKAIVPEVLGEEFASVRESMARKVTYDLLGIDERMETADHVDRARLFMGFVLNILGRDPYDGDVPDIDARQLAGQVRSAADEMKHLADWARDQEIKLRQAEMQVRLVQRVELGARGDDVSLLL